MARALITLGDMLRFGHGLRMPRQPVSLYRFLEHLIEVTVARKFGARRIIEFGPGADSIFSYLRTDDFDEACVTDYHPKVLDRCEAAFGNGKVRSLLTDFEKPGGFDQVGGDWDYVVANSIVEHMADDVAFVGGVLDSLKPGGLCVASTVLGERLFNQWDHAVGHYRRYSRRGLKALFNDFAQVQLVQTSVLQEWVRPLFFSRIRHLADNTIEENNRLFGEGQDDWGRPPYAPIYPVLRYLMPAYLFADWSMRGFQGGIGIIVARK